MRSALAPLLCLSAALALGGAAHAADVPAPVHHELGQVRLYGSGSYRWFGLKLYDASLWAYAGDPPPQSLAEPFALDLHYARSISGSAIAEASLKEMQRLGAGTPEQQAEWLQQMLRLFPDVAAGTHLTGIYRPDAGVRFYRDGRPLGEIADPAFGRAFFSIWLDRRTSAPDLREALLGTARP